jgi:hypothetical protein
MMREEVDGRTCALRLWKRAGEAGETAMPQEEGDA